MTTHTILDTQYNHLNNNSTTVLESSLITHAYKIIVYVYISQVTYYICPSSELVCPQAQLLLSMYLSGGLLTLVGYLRMAEVSAEVSGEQSTK